LNKYIIYIYITQYGGVRLINTEVTGFEPILIMLLSPGVVIYTQCDSRTFNRGATKNIGFIAARLKYTNDYKDITFIFNHVDNNT